MREIIIKTQQELDALPAGGFTEYTRIYIQNDRSIGRIVVRQSWGNSSVVAREHSSVVAREHSSVEAWGNSSVEAWGNSSVVARGNSSVVAWGNVGVRVCSADASVSLYMFAVCWVLFK